MDHHRFHGRIWKLSCLFLIALNGSVSGQDQTWIDQISEDFARELRLRSLGPALRPGRVSDIAVHPRNRSIWYVVVGSGGLWKTVNRGVSFESIFDQGGSHSLGCVAIDPREPDTIWLGTGENNSNRSVGFGDGIYKSTDAGASWERMGLPNSEHIGVILVHPGKSDVVYVAAEGPLWSSGGDRGLYKTTDGGRNWNCVLEISKHTGVTGVVFDPRDPEVLYAAAYQRQRHNGLLVGGGPETAIYKTTDGGGSWRKLENGIPTVDKGRIALAVSPHNPEVVYALVAAQGNESGFFRSANAGETWVRQSGFKVVDPQYYGEIYADPHQFDRIYAMDVLVQLSEDGGQTFKGMKWPIHVDNHAMVLDPTDVNHLLVGNDGGLYESYDRGNTWRHFVNMPTPQFYRVDVDDSLPFYNLYGGTQDNGSMAGPSRTVNRAGIRSSEWMVTGGSDGFQSRVDPEDPAIIYVTTQNGGISRLDKRTGDRTGITPKNEKDGPKIRWHWDAPFIISPFSPARLYLGGNRLFRSDDRGDNWRPVSGDLTRQLDAHMVPAMGRVWPEDAVEKNRFTTTLSVCSALEESPLNEGLLYVGTDDGLIQVSEDGGAQWRRCEQFPGIPRWAYVSDVLPSRHDVDVVYAAFNHYQEGDFKPYLLKSSDRGRNWTSIAANLPERGPVWSIVEDHVNPKLLFVGTEFGLYFSVDGGGHWTGLRGGVPVAAFRDLAIQRRENDLVGATFGRGFYVLDDYSALRDLTETSLAAEGTLLSSGGARAYHEATLLQAAPGNFATPNPAFGIVLTYHLRDGLTEDERLALVIEDADGKPVAEVEGDGSKGLHRLNWDLRAGKLGLQQQRRGSRAGTMVDPGVYTVKLVKVTEKERLLLGAPREVRVSTLPLAEPGR